jgi:hypothetical protein
LGYYLPNNPDEVGGYNTPLCGGIWVHGLALGFIPVIQKQDKVLKPDSCLSIEK